MIIKDWKKRYESLTITAKASLWAFFASIIQRSMSIIATPVYTRILTTEEYAQYTLYQSWFVIWMIFASLQVFNYSTYTALAKFDDKDGFISSAAGVIISLTALCGMTYFVLSCFFQDFLGFPSFIAVCMFLDILFYSIYNLWVARERYDYKYKLMAILSIIMGICEPVLGIGLTYLVRNKGYGRIYGVFAVHTLFGFFLFVAVLKKSKRLFFARYWKYIFRFGLPLLPHLLSTQILTRSDRIMINSLCNASDAGIYGLAYSLSMLMMIVNDAILNSFTPWTYHEMKDKNFGNIKDGANKVLMLVGMSNILLILFAPEAVKFFATKEYFQAVYIIPAVSASVYFTFLFNLFVNIEYYYAETKFVTAASVGAAATNVALNLFFIPRYGFIAAGYTTLISYIFYALGHFFFMRIVSRKHAGGYQFYDNKRILSVSIIFTVTALLIIPLYKYAMIRYILIALIIAVIGCNWKKIVFVIKKKEV